MSPLNGMDDDYRRTYERLLQDQKVAVSDAERAERKDQAVRRATELKINLKPVLANARFMAKNAKKYLDMKPIIDCGVLTEHDWFVRLLEHEIRQREKDDPS